MLYIIEMASESVSVSATRPGSSKAHRGNPGERDKGHSNVTGTQFKRFPDYVLCGSLNLHKSPVNAAALARYIAKQWNYLRINRDGIISSQQLEINRNPDAYGGLRDGKPLTVTEWKKIQKEKLLEKRKNEASSENVNAANAPATRGGRGGRGSNRRGRGRSSGRCSTGRGSSRGRSRGRRGGYQNINTISDDGQRNQSIPPINDPTSDIIDAGTNVNTARRGKRGRARARSRRGSNYSTRDRYNKAVQVELNPNDEITGQAQDNEGQAASHRKQLPLNIKLPRLAKRNLRDTGQLPRKRGPDKPSTSQSKMNSESKDLDFQLQDELVPDIMYPELPPVPPENLIQLDGNISLSETSSNVDDSGDEMLRDLYKPLIM